jgi:hypothetical protein
MVLRLRDGQRSPCGPLSGVTLRWARSKHGGLHEAARIARVPSEADTRCGAPSAAREWAALRDARHPRRRVHWGRRRLFASSRISR